MNLIGILGSGRVATALATGLAQGGRSVIIGTRDPQATSARWKGPPVEFAAPEDAARRASIVITATPGDSSVGRLSPLRDALNGKVLLDVANATQRNPDGSPGPLLYPDGSLAEQLQAALPTTFVVKGLNTMLFTVMADPHSLREPPTAFLSGDDPAAKSQVRALLVALGWPSDWVEDLGPLASARATEALILMAPFVIARSGFAPFALKVAR